MMTAEQIEAALQHLVILGDPRLYQECDEVDPKDTRHFQEWKSKMALVMEAIQSKFKFGRAIAAPQVGIMKRLILLNIDSPQLLINPRIVKKSDQTFELWDDCMSLPNLLVKVDRHKEITLLFEDENWQTHKWELRDSLSELLQHECDHLDGVLCTMRAKDKYSFKWRILD